MINLALQTTLACALALLFANAGLHKLLDRPRFAAQLAEYRLLPAGLVAFTGTLLGAVELLLAVALLVPGSREIAGLVAAVMLVGYAFAIAINLLRGRSYIDCGCGDTPQMLSGWLLVRNALLATGALTMMMSTSKSTFSWSDLAIAIPAFAVICGVYITAEQILENASALREWRELRD
jgi:hypothetical protein